MYKLFLSGIPLNIDWRQILLHLLNLVILFLILYFLLYNPVKKFMEKRKKLYEEQDERGKTALAEAEEKKSTYDELMSKADEEISEKKRLVIADARDESEKIIKAAEEQGLEAGSDEYKQAVIDAIAGGTIEGITGTFTFDEHHNPVKSTAILTYVDGKPELKEMF